jgi:hypothetical protein
MNWITKYEALNEEITIHMTEPKTMLLLLASLGIMLIVLTISNAHIIYSEPSPDGEDDGEDD